MKKTVLFVVVALFTCSFNSFSQTQAIKNGFSMQFQIGFPSLEYGLEEDANIDSDYKAGNLLGFQIGNRWYVFNNGTVGVYINANWFDLTYSGKTIETDYTDLMGNTSEVEIKKRIIDMSLLEVGPGFTFAPTKDIGLDVYYMLQPTSMFSYHLDDNGDGMLGAGFGITHAMGFAFRYSIFYVGLEREFGKVNASYTEIGNANMPEIPDGKLVTNNFRVLLGFKF